jgi:hypothetical protein
MARMPHLASLNVKKRLSGWFAAKPFQRSRDFSMLPGLLLRTPLLGLFGLCLDAIPFTPSRYFENRG